MRYDYLHITTEIEKQNKQKQQQNIYRVGQIKRSHAFQLITSEVQVGSLLFWAETRQFNS